VVEDRNWAAERRCAVQCGAALTGMLVLLDWVSGGLDPVRCVCWTALGVGVGVVMLPDRISAGRHWLAARNSLGTHRVRTDVLTSVRAAPGRTGAVVLHDAFGGRAVVDVDVLINNPQLWHRLDTGIRHSEEAGTLHPCRTDATLLLTIADKVDYEMVLRIFTASDIR
jgi:hypothetical protein